MIGVCRHDVARPRGRQGHVEFGETEQSRDLAMGSM